MDFAAALAQVGKLATTNVVKAGRHFPLVGGLNVMDSPMDIPPGELAGCLNFEPSVIGGYRRFDGYERVDGHPSPSDTEFISLDFTTENGFAPNPGDTVTDDTSGASGTVAYLDDTNAAVVLVNLAGTFTIAGAITSGTQHATIVGSPNVNGGKTDVLSNLYYYQKWLYLQAAIGTLGGAACSGPVRGVWPHLDHVYAWRDNATATAGLMFVDSPTGWQLVNLGLKVRYSGGVYTSSMQAPPEGAVVTGATSGATFTIQRVATLTGTWGTDAAGYIITSAITGTPVAGEAFGVSGTPYFTYTSSAEQTIPPGGVYQLRSHNFDCAQDPATGFRIYGTNGVGNGFEYDPVGGVYVAIETGMDVDTPTHLEIHADYLFFAFHGGSLQNSGYQLPLNWNPVFGADARQVGEDVTFMREDVSQSLIIGTRRRIWILVGLQVEQFQIRVYSANTGAYAQTDEIPGQIIFADDRGITTVAASSQYGDFEASTLTDKILDVYTDLMTSDAPVGAIVTRKKNLYRLVFASGHVLCLAINTQGKFSGWTSGTYMHAPSCVSSGFWQGPSGPQIERAFVGGQDGYVYELDKGRSFDGQAVQFFFKLAYEHEGSPNIFKRWRRVQIDVRPEGQAAVLIGADCDYGNRTGQAFPPVAMRGGGGLWDVANWDRFTWNSPVYTGLAVKLELEGFNVSLIMSGTAVNDTPFTVTGASYQFSPRIVNRNTQEA